MSALFTCRICGGSATSDPIVATEMMFATRDTFEYRECSNCGCVQISEYPANVGGYYREGYYSMKANGVRRAWPLEAWIRRRRATYALGRTVPIGTALDRLLGIKECYGWLKHAGMHLGSSILDVGCGNGGLLAFLRDEGFGKLEGVDPFAQEELRSQRGFVIRAGLGEVREKFDFVLLSHSLEHMPGQARVLEELRTVCSNDGWLCIRIPVINEAFRIYGSQWVSLDPPRHYYLHTRRSFERLATDAGFRIESIHYDSWSFQFWGSEQYRRGIALNDPRGHGTGFNGKGQIFSRRQIKSWERQAAELNRAGKGDQATFYLRLKDRS